MESRRPAHRTRGPRTRSRGRGGLYLALLGVFGCLLGVAIFFRANAVAQPHDPNTIAVSNTAELQKALRNARGGITLELAPGDYGQVRIVGTPEKPRFAQTLTIRSADPCNPARLAQLALRGVSNVTIDGLRFESPRFFNRPRAELFARNGGLQNLYLLRTDDVSDITIRNSTFAGPTVHVPGAPVVEEGYGHGFGWAGKGIRRTSFTNNESTNLYKAISISDVDTVEIAGNSMHDYRSDALYIKGAHDLTIADNRMSDPRPLLRPNGVGDHPDFIQLEDVSGGRIENNYMDVGLSADGSQGIFSRAASDMVVRNNVIATRGVNALTFNSLANSQIANNLVVFAVVPPGAAFVQTRPEVYEPILRIRPSYTGTSVTGNLASKYSHDFDRVARGSQITVAGNALVQSNLPRGRNYYRYQADGQPAPAGAALSIGKVWLSSVPAGAGPDPAKFAYLAKGTSRAPGGCRRP